MEKYREKNNLHMVFIDLKKAYDKHQERSFGLEKKGVPSRYIDLVKDIYDGGITSVRTIRGRTS